MQREWPQAVFSEDTNETATTIEAMFYRKPSTLLPLSLFVQGTNFQINVWQALLNIKEGEVASYGEIAKIMGKPKAARAVGTAIGANPVAFIIPCHRVIRQSGSLGGYRWGVTRKHAMLAREAAINR